MGIGSGIFLVVVGAILAFALNVQVSWIDVQLVGYILMGAGVVVFILSLIFMLRRRQTTTIRRGGVDPATGERIQEQRTRSDDF
ncbi:MULTISPECIES: DUF6458 family protein [unclassified Leifsonia]|uniref:DUF6458 family protein n=1 Tax=unclassified Leifsonia TaxID=2663824 RepID=UPI000A1913E6|nr:MULTISPECIES: DUF6458 family protein [unclassified Leifsonia]QIZ97137.1 hypothetical protein HF024_00320 [Leifsonia sp. PS1209]